MIRIFLVAAFFPLAAQAQDEELARYRSAIEPCVMAAGSDGAALEACAGRLSEACMEGEPGGMSNLGMASCVRAEAAFWDERLNAEWRRLIARVKEADLQSEEYEPDFAVREDRLRAAQRAWIGFRDAQCAYDYAVFGAGSLRQLMYPSCLSDLTMKRLTDLIAMRMQYEG